MNTFAFEDDANKIRSKRLHIDQNLKSRRVLVVMPYDCSFGDFFELLLRYCYHNGLMINREGQFVGSNALSDTETQGEEERDLEDVMAEIDQLLDDTSLV